MAALGEGVSGLRVGDRVAALTYRAHAEYDLAEASAVVPLPPSLDGVPMPGEPLGCAFNIFERSGIEAGQTVAIVGIGFLGALLTRSLDAHIARHTRDPRLRRLFGYAAVFLGGSPSTAPKKPR